MDPPRDTCLSSPLTNFGYDADEWNYNSINSSGLFPSLGIGADEDTAAGGLDTSLTPPASPAAAPPPRVTADNDTLSNNNNNNNVVRVRPPAVPARSGMYVIGPTGRLLGPWPLLKKS